MNLKTHVGSIGALLITVLTVAQSAGHLDRGNIVQVGVAVLTALGLWAGKNTTGPVRQYTKGIVAVLGAGLQAVGPYLATGRITYAECLVVAAAAIQALEVYLVPDGRLSPPTNPFVLAPPKPGVVKPPAPGITVPPMPPQTAATPPIASPASAV